MPNPTIPQLEALANKWRSGASELPLNLMLLRQPPDLLAKSCSITGGDTLTFSTPHGFVEGELICLGATAYPSGLPLINTYTHPYYWAVAVTATTCKLSATTPALGSGGIGAITALGTGAAGLTARSIDLPTEFAAQTIYSRSLQGNATMDTIFNATLLKSEVVLPTPRPALTFASALPVIERPSTWPAAGELSAYHEGQVTVSNPTSSPIVYRHAILWRPASGSLPAGAPIFLDPGLIDTTIPAGSQQIITVKLGYKQGAIS